MKKPILVTYATMAGSTGDSAGWIADEIVAAGHPVKCSPIAAVADITGFAGVILGAPMILGFHRGARAFLRHHRRDFTHVPLAVFTLAMSLTETGTDTLHGVPVYVDPSLPKLPETPGRLNLHERYANASSYLGPVLRTVRPVKPAGMAIFGGRMEYGRLKWWAVLFAMGIVRAPAGDKRDETQMRAWAREIAEMWDNPPTK